MKHAFIIGITGGSASGKTLFLSRLTEKLGDGNLCLISQDNYYLPRDQQPVDENGVSNFDLPQSIDFDEFTRDILALRSGTPVTRREYTFNNADASPRILEFSPAPILIVEGIFVFYEKKVSDLCDLKLFIDAQEHIKLKRRIIRDKVERGYDIDDVLYRYEYHVAPTYEKYIDPYKNEADLIIPNNQGFDKALEILVTYLGKKL